MAPYLIAFSGDDLRAPVFAIFVATSIMGVSAGGWATDRFGPQPTLIGGMAAFIALMCGFGVLGYFRPISIALVYLLAAVGGSLAYSSATAVQVRLHALAGPMTAKVRAVNSGLGAVGVAAGATVGGLIVSAGAVLSIPFVTAAACVAGMLLLLIAFRGTTQ